MSATDSRNPCFSGSPRACALGLSAFDGLRTMLRCVEGSMGAIVFAWLVFSPVSALAADDPLARARQLYNQRQFLEAVNAAEQARQLPAHADLDRLVVMAIVPDRARVLGQPVDGLRAQWEQFKDRWK